MTSRSDIATALNTITGLTAVADWPATPTPGLAWPRLVEVTTDPFPMSNWEVYVALPADLPSAEAQYDLYEPQLRDALQPYMYVETVSKVQVGQNGVLAALVTGRSE